MAFKALTMKTAPSTRRVQVMRNDTEGTNGAEDTDDEENTADEEGTDD